MTKLTQSLWQADTSEPVLDVTVGRLLQQAATDVPTRRPSCRWRLTATNPALRAAELAYALEKSHAKGIFYVKDFRGSDMASVVDSVAPGLGELRELVPFEGWLDDVRRTTKLEALPLFHTAGCGSSGMGTVHERGTLVLAEVFHPASLLKAMQDHRAEVLGGVPAMLHALLFHPGIGDLDLSSLKVIMSGGDLVPAALVEGWNQLCGASASSVYGQTELSPVICQTRPTDAQADNLFTAGQLLPQVDVAVLDPHTGEIHDHPRRRKHLSSGDRGSPDHPSRDRERGRPRPRGPGLGRERRSRRATVR